MLTRLSALIACSLIVGLVAVAKDKNKTNLPDSILQAHTVRVVVSPDAGQPLNHPTANLAARDAVENALEAWGRFTIVHEGESDLVIAVRTNNGQLVSPTIESGPTDTRIGGVQYGKVTVGVQQGNGPALSDPTATPQHTAPHVGKQIGGVQDIFEVYKGEVPHPTSFAPLWKFAAKDALKAPDMPAVREFRKAIAVAENQKKKP